MPVMQNTISSSPEKSMPLSTAKPPSMDTAAAASRKKYQVLRVNLSFIAFLPPAAECRLLTKFSKN